MRARPGRGREALIPIPWRAAALLVVIFGYLSHVTDGRFLALRPGPWTSVGLRFPNMRHQQDRDLWPRTAVNARKVGKKTQLHYYQCTKYLLRCSSNTVSTR